MFSPTPLQVLGHEMLIRGSSYRGVHTWNHLGSGWDEESKNAEEHIGGKILALAMLHPGYIDGILPIKSSKLFHNIVQVFCYPSITQPSNQTMLTAPS